MPCRLDLPCDIVALIEAGEREREEEEDEADEHAAARVEHALAEGLVRHPRVARDGHARAHPQQRGVTRGCARVPTGRLNETCKGGKAG